MTTTKFLAVYYTNPIEQTRHKYVLVNPTREQTAHYLDIAAGVASGHRFRCIGLVGFRELDVASDALGPRIDFMILVPNGLGAIRVEGEDAPVLVQESLLGGVA